MASSARSPRMLRGALVGVDTFSLLMSTTIFQYNPDTLTRTLQSRGGDAGAGAEVLRLRGAPIETIRLDVEIDATDRLESDDGIATGVGIHPQLAALETLLYPKSSLVIVNTALMLAGSLEVVPPMAPLTLFIWGPARVLPVRVSDFSVTEEAHDHNLNPVRAKVSLSLRVLTYDDVPVSHPIYSLFLAHHVVKEAMAAVASFGNLASVLGGETKLF
ncbi:MAG TPA: hypothetical protein VM694_14100 [Polyangium sp.]|nr:hypothetical protein [Polyangium sp.]